ncbi:gustatory receptor for sugar taste 43a-like [Zophobas morio]|uniref:gustatory receptor for sugar taste 43a-like n=1 Tax=Zophobas morio TaxID=2755281 RepID=UPI003083CE12
MTNPSVKISTEMFDTMSPILYLSRMMCLQPLKWKKSDFTCAVIKSRFYIACSCVVCTVIVLYGIYGLYMAYQTDVVYTMRLKTSAGRYVSYTDVAVVLGTFSIGVIITSSTTDDYLSYFYHLSKVDQLLQKRLPRGYNYTITTAATLFAGFAIFVFDLATWLHLASKNESPYFLLICLVPYYVAYFSLFVIELLYWQLVYSIKIRLFMMNSKLRQIQNGGNVENPYVKVSNSVTGVRKIETVKGKLIKSTSLEKVEDLMKAYESLGEAARIVNKCYGLVIAIVLLGCLIHLLVTAYAIRSLVASNGSDMYVVAQCVWMVVHIMRLVLIIEPCHGCLMQWKKALALICKVRISDPEDSIKKSMDFFLGFLSQCKIEFTAFGLATIDRGLMLGIAGTVTTYLVILLEFN